MTTTNVKKSSGNKKSVRSVTPYHIYHIGGTFILPAPVGMRGKVTDLERLTVSAPNPQEASFSAARFLNSQPRWVKLTQGEGFSPTFFSTNRMVALADTRAEVTAD